MRFWGRRPHPLERDNNEARWRHVSHELDYQSKLLDWLTRHLHEEEMNIEKVIAEITQQRSLIAAALKLLNEIKAAIDHARGQPDAAGALHQLSETLDSNIQPLADALAKSAEPKAEAAAETTASTVEPNPQMAEEATEEEESESHGRRSGRRR